MNNIIQNNKSVLTKNVPNLVKSSNFFSDSNLLKGSKTRNNTNKTIDKNVKILSFNSNCKNKLLNNSNRHSTLDNLSYKKNIKLNLKNKKRPFLL